MVMTQSASVPALTPAKTVAAARDLALRSLDRLPPLSPSAAWLLSKLAFRSVDFRELSKFVEKDSLLCAHILRTVNSAGFARRSTITSIRQAMSLLGIHSLRKISIGLTVSNLFSKTKAAPTWSRARFNLHAGATALLTEAIVDELPVQDKEGAFVAGMLHDLGALLIAVGLPEDFETISAFSAVACRPTFECEREILGFDHAELSGIALAKWSIPDVICRSVYHHHSPDAAEAPWLATVINRADAFVNHLGVTILPARAPVDREAPSLEIPGFEYDQPAVLKRFEVEWKELASFFQ